MEKLLEHIFDRKNQIIERTKNDADSYTQQIVSKLLIAGLTPPLPLLRRRNPNLAANEFKKAELLSQLLLPRPQSTDANRGSFYSLYNQSNKGYNLEDGTTFISNFNNIEIGSSLNAHDQDVSANDNDLGCLLVSAPELDPGIVSPQGQTKTSISSNIRVPYKSISRIQRSKSRQKALGVRKTAKKADETHQKDMNSGVVSYDREGKFSNASKQCQPHQDDESLGPALNVECLSKKEGGNSYSGRLIRSRISNNVERSPEIGHSLDISNVDDGKAIRSVNNYVEEVSHSVKLLNGSSQRVTLSKSGDKKCISQNEPSSELVLYCPDSYENINQKTKIGCLVETEVIKPKTLDFEVGKSRLVELNIPIVEKNIYLEECIVDDERVTQSKTGNNVEEISDAVDKIQHSPVLHVEETRSSNVDKDVDMETYHEMEETIYVPNQQVQKEFPTFDGKDFTADELRSLEQTSIQGRKPGSISADTWPRPKRRKIENHENKFISGDFRVKEIPINGGSSTNRILNSIGLSSGTELRFQISPSSHEENMTRLDADETCVLEILPNDLTQEAGSFPEMPIQEDELVLGERSHLMSFPLSNKDGECFSFAASSSSNEEAENSEIYEEDIENGNLFGDSFDSLNLPTNSLERASLLEQLCKSAVMQTPVYNFSTTHNLRKTPDACQSVPNGVLENHLIPQSTLNPSNDGSKQLRASYSSVYETLPISDTYYGHSFKVPPISPVSELWGRISSQSLSSEKKMGSNPEHVCFPIEEDPVISEEQEEKDEVVNSVQEDIFSMSKDFGDKRIPLSDISQVYENPLLSENSRDSSSLDSVNTHEGVKKKVTKRRSSKRIGQNEANKKLTLSTSTNSLGIFKESLNNRFSKPNLTRKNSLRNAGERMSGKELKHTNIIGNISSFLPLLQQKQAAAVITEKRDVKVKALEAAEAAKRLEEKKDNERKLKRVALKIERARTEKENLHQDELKRKKKEVDLKKKEADVAARKRLREEEGKKERERKRKRFEGKRQQIKEQEEKLRSRKAGKDSRTVPIDAKLNIAKKVKVYADKGNGKNSTKPTQVVASNGLHNDDRKATLGGLEDFENSRVCTEVTKTRREISYDISPYQCSDDEDDEEDEISPKKYVPKWASKKSLALVVSSQQSVDPDVLFSPKSFVSVDEVSGLDILKNNRRL